MSQTHHTVEPRPFRIAEAVSGAPVQNRFGERVALAFFPSAIAVYNPADHSVESCDLHGALHYKPEEPFLFMAEPMPTPDYEACRHYVLEALPRMEVPAEAWDALVRLAGVALQRQQLCEDLILTLRRRAA